MYLRISSLIDLIIYSVLYFRISSLIDLIIQQAIFTRFYSYIQQWVDLQCSTNEYTVSNNLETELFCNFCQCYLYQMAEMSAVQRKKNPKNEVTLIGHLFIADSYNKYPKKAFKCSRFLTNFFFRFDS